MTTYSYSRFPIRGGRRRRRRRRRSPILPIILMILAVILLLAGIVFAATKIKKHFSSSKPKASVEETLENGEPVPESSAAEETESVPALDKLLADAERLAAMYDYDAAKEMILGNEEAAASEEGQAAVARYDEIKSTLVRQDPQQITHVFFHTLIMDNSKAFDGDTRQDGYNEVMTTKSEFLKILDSMYARGFVLVNLHDIAYEVDDTENGGKKMVWGDIMLPEGKKAFVMSQDDVSYYEYMDGDGFASRFVIDERGRVMNEMIMDDGSVEVGSFDMVPLLDDFVEEHPDFSYRGAKAAIALTGYNGIFGYRTDASYEETNPNIEEDRQKAREIAEALKASGYEIASHSWGHKNYGKISMENLHTDNEKWQKYVGELIGGTDVIIFAFGGDIADWHPYTNENERFNYLWSQGFRYFCNVDSTEYFVQKGNSFLRQGRRNLDGYRMWQDQVSKNRTSDLFDVNEVFDKERPTPVPSYTGG